jgi:hypothetical protein
VAHKLIATKVERLKSSVRRAFRIAAKGRIQNMGEQNESKIVGAESVGMDDRAGARSLDIHTPVRHLIIRWIVSFESIFFASDILIF